MSVKRKGLFATFLVVIIAFLLIGCAGVVDKPSQSEQQVVHTDAKLTEPNNRSDRREYVVEDGFERSNRVVRNLLVYEKNITAVAKQETTIFEEPEPETFVCVLRKDEGIKVHEILQVNGQYWASVSLEKFPVNCHGYILAKDLYYWIS